MKINRKIVARTLLGIAVTIGIANQLIGKYFVNFALVPGSGGENRQVIDEDDSPTDVTLDASSTYESTIDSNRELFEQERDDFIQSHAGQTEDVSIVTDDQITLHGHIYWQEEPSDKWAIIVHGYQSDESEAQLIAPYFYQEGFNVLTYNLRSHGNSEGEYIGMGYLDQHDLIQWTEYVIELDPSAQIVYHGTSMGGATVSFASGLETLPSNIRAIIEDCGYSSIMGIFEKELYDRFKLPAFPVLHMANNVAGQRAGYYISDGDVAAAVAKSTVPMLFIHGELDDFVPMEMGIELYEAKQEGAKEWILFEGAGHAESKYVDPARYFDSIFDFIHPYLD